MDHHKFFHNTKLFDAEFSFSEFENSDWCLTP